MKILHLVNRYPRPSHSFIRREIRGLEDLGAEVTRVSVRTLEGESLPDPDDCLEAEKTIFLLDGGGLGLLPSLLGVALRHPLRFLSTAGLACRLSCGGDRGLLAHLAYLGEACRLLFLCRRKAIQHCHAHFGTNPAAVAFLLQYLGGPPFSMTIHGPEEFDRPLALKLREKMAAARFTVAISHYGRGQLRRWCRAEDANRIHVVHCGVDAAFLDQMPEPLPTVPRMVSVGRLCPQKAPLDLIEAAGVLAKEGLDFELVLAGDGELRSPVEAAITRLGLQDRVRITGWISAAEVLKEIDRARVFVLPSSAEGLPVVIMEALARGRPVISTFVAGIPELVHPGESGWLVPTSNGPALAEAMREALQADSATLTAMGQRGAEEVRQHHNSAREAARLLDLIRESSA